MPVPLYYTDTGDGLPVVFIHAFPLNSEMWKPQVEALSSGYRIITYDLPGFARGGELSEPTSMDQCADDLIELLDSLNIDSCVAAGCSMGGYIAMAVLRKIAHRIKGLILADTRAGEDTTEGKENRYKQAADVRANGLEGLIQTMTPKLISDTGKRNNPGLEHEVRQIMAASKPEGAARMLEAMAIRHDSSASLASLDIPTCLIVGEHDALTPPSETQKMHDLIRVSEMHVIPAAAHLSNMENPAVFNSIVLDFLRRLDS